MATDEEAARQARARARAGWPGRKLRLDELPEHEVVVGTPGELMGMVTELTLAAWAMRGEALPSYPRAQMPGRILRKAGDGL
jgi:hypothetical protein